MIKIRNLSKSFGNHQVLDNVNITLEKGKVYGFVGENGAGKTTFFRCIVGLENFGGEITSEYDNLKNHIGLLQTNPPSMSWITGWEYLKLFCTARDISTDSFEQNNIFSLPLNQYIENYSTGMFKKLALMAILLQKNDIYILDEPFNGVDIHSNILISEIIAKLKSLNKIILISSHIFSTLSQCCDEISLLKDRNFGEPVTKENFDQLENEMKDFVVGNKIEKLPI